MSALIKLLKFIALSLLWWCMGTVLVFFTLLPCGMGPDADCYMGPTWAIWLALAGAIVGYIGLCGILYRRWLTKEKIQ